IENTITSGRDDLYSGLRFFGGLETPFGLLTPVYGADGSLPTSYSFKGYVHSEDGVTEWQWEPYGAIFDFQYNQQSEYISSHSGNSENSVFTWSLFAFRASFEEMTESETRPEFESDVETQRFDYS